MIYGLRYDTGPLLSYLYLINDKSSLSVGLLLLLFNHLVTLRHTTPDIISLYVPYYHFSPETILLVSYYF